jgi:GDPmannose 4,6-dehydratase
MRAFVTGIGGQDGSYLAERLLADGAEVHGLTHAADDLRHCPDGVVLHRGDVTDLDRTRCLLVDLAPDEVYNLAALSSVAESWERPAAVEKVNATGAVALMDAAYAVQQRTGRRVAFVQASSAEIFGRPAVSPQDEATPVAPVNPYGAAKAAAHAAARAWRERGLHVVSAVLYNHESPRRPTRFVTRKITSTVAAIARGRAERLTLGNLDARRDWGWAPDYVDAMVRAARAPEADDYVVATGESRSVRDFATAAFAHAGIDDAEERLGTDPSLVRPVDAVELVGDASRARDRLGWSPTVGFAELVGRMVDADLAALPPQGRSSSVR